MKNAGLFVILFFRRKDFEKSTCFLLAGFMNKIRMDLELLEQFLFHCGNDIMSLLEKENSVRFI